MNRQTFIVAIGLIEVASAALNWSACSNLNRQITQINGVQGATFDCATLEVPLDYTLDDSPPLELSLFRVNATRQPARGTVLLNFGGPGVTGGDNLAVAAAPLASIIGEEWNLLSWDPRGTAQTLPVECDILSASGAETNLRRQNDDRAFTSANLTEFFVDSGWDAAGLIARYCSAAMRNNGGDLIGTAFGARDMIQIVDALEEDGFLRYYGTSYGTILGDYVSAMFPERVERVVLDGNVNPHDYQTGTWGDFLADADKAYLAFIDECFRNADDCALAQYANASDAMDIQNVLDQAIRPLALSATNSGNIGWLAYSGVLQPIFQTLYSPARWPALAEMIVSFFEGTYEPDTNSSVLGNQYNPSADSAYYGIRAGDALDRYNTSTQYLPIVRFQDTVSSFDISYIPSWVSAQWRLPAKERYRGNFTATTRHPILFVNGEYDPVTPLVSAYNASAGFAGSAVLAHSGYGHTLVAHPSECAARYIQAYFINGTLPPSDARCAPDMGAWELARSSQANQTNIVNNGDVIGGDGNDTLSGNNGSNDTTGGTGDGGSGGTGGAGQATISMLAVCMSLFAYLMLL